MFKTYYTLVEKLPGQPWAIAFGDYSRRTVDLEAKDMHDSGSWVRGTKLRVLATCPSQGAIANAVAALNAA